MRVFTLSEDTLLLRLWDKLHPEVDPLINRPVKDLENNPPPDISGNWVRTARAMECRNPPEMPGLKSDTNPRGSRSEVIPPDVDRAKTAELGYDVARPLPWNIAQGETTTRYTGGGSGSVHDHDSSICYKGIVNGKHHFYYRTARSIPRVYTSDVTKAIIGRIYKKFGREHITTNMFGVIIVDQDVNGKISQLTSVITETDGRDPDLPKRFKEISIWKLNPAPV